MKYLLGIVVSFVLLSVVISSCSSTKTYAQMLHEEQVAIDEFITAQGFTVRTDFPTDTVFAPNEYIKFSNGLYMHIIYRGNLSMRPKTDTTNVLIRFKDYFNLLDPEDSSYIDGNWFARAPQEFIYGSSTRTGWEYPLQYLGDSARVSLIVPSKLGTSDEQSAVTPYYFGIFRYTFEK